MLLADAPPEPAYGTGVLLLIAHRPLVQDLQDAWLTRRPRRR